MKKILSLIIAIIIVCSAVVTVSAYTPLEPTEMVYRHFVNYYSQQTNGGQLKSVMVYDATDYFGSTYHKPYYMVKFTSDNAQEQDYFNRLGKDRLHYETSPVTNELFPSGYAVFSGNCYNSADSENFYSLDTICKKDPAVIEYISKLIGVEAVGTIGAVNSVADLNVDVVTTIQKISAELITDGIDKRMYDFNNDGITNINDATWLQFYLAK